MGRWNSLYWLSESAEDAEARIAAYLSNNGYIRYHPFGRLPGASYPVTLKTFIAPAQGAWVRVLLDEQSDPAQVDDLAAVLSQAGDCLMAALDGKVGLLHAFRAGQVHDLAAFLRDHAATQPADIDHLLALEQYDLPPISAGKIGDVPLDDLPPELRSMADKVNPKQANSLFERISQQFLQAAGRGAGREMFQRRPDWDSQGGQYLRVLLGATTIAAGWRTPDFATLRSAYTVHARRADSASAFTLPGDDQAADAVPDALSYTPVYGGKPQSSA